MVIITRTIMKYNWYFSWSIIHQITYFVCYTSIFSCVMTMISYFNIIIFFIFKYGFLHKKQYFLLSCLYCSSCVNLINSFFSKSTVDLACFLSLGKTFSNNLYLYNSQAHYFSHQMSNV